jgi:hypothetical protein
MINMVGADDPAGLPARRAGGSLDGHRQDGNRHDAAQGRLG